MTERPHSLIESPAETAGGPAAPSADLISELLTSMRLRGVDYRRVHAGPSFDLSFHSEPGRAYFHFVAAGGAILRTEDGSEYELASGNAVFVPHGGRHRLLSMVGVYPPDAGGWNAVPIPVAVSEMDACWSAGSGPGTVFFTGAMEFDLGGMQGLSHLMPKVMIADAEGKRYPGLMPILNLMRSETCAARIGFGGILARLAEAAAAMIVRGWVECGCENSSGLLAALRDPRLAKALLALHQRPGHHWTVAELAAECHVSRSVFAERFQVMIGVPPLRYAMELRMLLASQLLVQGTVSVESVARRLGYTSAASFSRAFKRVVGHSPTASREVGHPQVVAG